MQSLLIILFLLHKATFKMLDVEKVKYCGNLSCLDIGDESVCGFRTEGDGFRLKLFENECQLLKYGCEVDEERAYGLINKEYCEQPSAGFNGISNYPDFRGDKLNNVLFYENSRNKTPCEQYRCIDNYEVCGIREDGTGYRIRLFDSKCNMEEYNCYNDVVFKETDIYICKPDGYGKTNNDETIDDVVKNITNLVVVDSNILGDYDNINDSIDSFFAASHVFDLPVKEVETLNTRRRWLKYAGPVNVFVPWIVKPKNISNDTFNIPTLSSCYHRCPTKCPDTYAPVCGVPGIVAREPSIMFQNHCFMDVAQCKMFWENRSSTAQSSSYLEASFLFCMGDEMNAVYRFLPAIRTLQHMGRLKKKGKFRAKLRNFRYLSEFRSGRPKFMG